MLRNASFCIILQVTEASLRNELSQARALLKSMSADAVETAHQVSSLLFTLFLKLTCKIYIVIRMGSFMQTTVMLRLLLTNVIAEKFGIIIIIMMPFVYLYHLYHHILCLQLSATKIEFEKSMYTANHQCDTYKLELKEARHLLVLSNIEHQETKRMVWYFKEGDVVLLKG